MEYGIKQWISYSGEEKKTQYNNSKLCNRMYSLSAICAKFVNISFISPYLYIFSPLWCGQIPCRYSMIINYKYNTLLSPLVWLIIMIWANYVTIFLVFVMISAHTQVMKSFHSLSSRTEYRTAMTTNNYYCRW